MRIQIYGTLVVDVVDFEGNHVEERAYVCAEQAEKEIDYLSNFYTVYF